MKEAWICQNQRKKATAPGWWSQSWGEKWRCSLLRNRIRRLLFRWSRHFWETTWQALADRKTYVKPCPKTKRYTTPPFAGQPTGRIHSLLWFYTVQISFDFSNISLALLAVVWDNVFGEGQRTLTSESGSNIRSLTSRMKERMDKNGWKSSMFIQSFHYQAGRSWCGQPRLQWPIPPLGSVHIRASTISAK